MAEASMKCRCGNQYLEERIGGKFYAPSKLDRGTPSQLRPVSGEKRVKYICLDCGQEVYESPETAPKKVEDGES